MGFNYQLYVLLLFDSPTAMPPQITFNWGTKRNPSIVYMMKWLLVEKTKRRLVGQLKAIEERDTLRNANTVLVLARHLH